MATTNGTARIPYEATPHEIALIEWIREGRHFRAELIVHEGQPVQLLNVRESVLLEKLARQKGLITS